MAQLKVNLALFSFLTLSLLISLEGFGQSQCLCEFEKGTDKDGYATVNIFSMDQENYGLMESIQYKVMRDDVQKDNAQHEGSYSIQVQLNQAGYRYQVNDLQLFFEENRIGYMSNLHIGLTKIVSHLLPESCSRASQIQSSQVDLLFNAKL